MAFFTNFNIEKLSKYSCVLQSSLDENINNNSNNNLNKKILNNIDNENFKVITNDNNKKYNNIINSNNNYNNSNDDNDINGNDHNNENVYLINNNNNGAKCLRLPKITTFNIQNNCDLSFVHSSQLFKVFFYKFMNCVLNMIKYYSFQTDKRCKNLRLLRILSLNNSKTSTITNTTTTKKITTKIRRTKTTIIKSINIPRKYLITFLISCIILCCIDNTECRPNLSSTTTATNGGSGGEGAITNGQTNLGSPSSISKEPTSFTDSNKNFVSAKSAALTTDYRDNIDINSENYLDSDDVTHYAVNEKETKGFPVIQVEFQKLKTPFIISVWILSASIAKIGFHITPKLHKIFPESCLLIVVGIIIGLVLFFGTKLIISPLTPTTFFFYILPPIILDAGYFMPNRLFFDNLGTILLFAVIGTIFNTLTIGGSIWACGLTGMFGSGPPPLLESLLFSSIISAVDPVAVLAVFEEIHVNEILYIVVFGESLLNDAVTVVLYHMMEAYNEIGINNLGAGDFASGFASFFVVALGGTTVGVIWGLLTGLITRFTDHVRVIEPIFIFIMAYLAYLTAEIFHMSGILAITFCGITMKNYVEANISQKSHTTVKYALKMLSSSSETIIFIFLGVATVNHHHVWNTVFVIMTVLFCSFFRIIGVILLSALANHFRLHKLSKVDQFVMSYGGLRGAVAFALVLLVDDHVTHKEMFVTTTIAVIYFTVFVQGITIKPLVKYLNVKRASKRKPTMNERIHERFMDHLMAGVEDIVGKTGNYNLRDKFKRFDNRFIRPLLIRDLQGAEPKILETYSKLTMKDAMEVIRRNPSTIGQMSGTESMSALFRNYTNNYLGGRCATSLLTTCPSLTNLETCSRNLDMHELDYNPSKKDLTDAKIHHLLAQELKPYKRASLATHRRLSYSRHAVDDRDLSTQVNYKMHMNIRRIINDRKHHKRSKRGGNKQEGMKQNHVSFHDFEENGTNKQLTNEEDSLKPSQTGPSGNGVSNDDWDDGLTFTAKSSPDADRANNNSLIAHITSLPGFDTSKARIVKHYASKSNSPEKCKSPADIGPTAAELILPWRRDRSYHSFGETPAIPEEDRNMSRDSDGERNAATPTAIESQLPWKRNEDESEDGGPVKQNEFPAWASNKEYLAYNSPSATFLGGLTKPKQAKSVIGLFRRESSGSGSVIGVPTSSGIIEGLIGSDPSLIAGGTNSISPQPITNIQNSSSTMPGSMGPLLNRGGGGHDKRSASISGIGLNEGHSGPFPITASHRRNTRRGSMLELSGHIIPEENNGYDSYGHHHSHRQHHHHHHHHHSKSLCENDDEWSTATTNSLRSSTPPTTSTIVTITPNTITSLNTNTSSNSPGKLNRDVREPLLPKSITTPKSQLRRAMLLNKSPVTTALLSSSATSDTEDDNEHDYYDDYEYDDDEEEDLDVYDDDLIMNTSVTNIKKRSLDRNQRT